ncbi:hypothetical protein CANCADRAFT_108260 [Tortispora caseinolytica NRRL Y-17796]|uniref:Mitochondrial outer membrane transport complex Sam37/metaxin N-terminal domain-containing protein n=1 Tax=Tortispora caseinolytica NRRL Y-17796 TaxID=767744 RepID=A0A1E4TFT0_9ASCO|nr:hypothetical protein CANCADRAFT_108260 [Tortispora caseinolytica NRRL Y-17796]
MKLFTWGGLYGLPSFSADDLIVISYLNALDISFELVPSNNIYLTPYKELPVLEHRNKRVSGCEGIIAYLKSGGFNLDADLSATGSALNVLLVNYMSHYLKIVTDFNQCFHRQNFDDQFRPGFVSFAPFPHQYYLPFLYRSDSKHRAIAKGIDFHMESDATFNAGKTRPVFPSGQAKIEEARAFYSKYKPAQDESARYAFDNTKLRKKVNLDAEPTSTFRALLLAEEVYSVLNHYIESTPRTADSVHLIENRLTTADIYLAVHLILQYQVSYPNNFLKHFIDFQFPELKRFSDMYTPKELWGDIPGKNIRLSDPKPSESISILSAIRSFLAR